jgi:hypothetical protein
LALHLLKLCVGSDTVEALLAWRRESAEAGRPWILRTRQTPKRAAELIDGGSLYRVYKGFILSRQRILAVSTVGEGEAKRCEMTLDETVVLTAPTPRRAFQGWRYLPLDDAPPDLGQGGDAAPMPADLARRLRDLGAW